MLEVRDLYLDLEIWRVETEIECQYKVSLLVSSHRQHTRSFTQHISTLEISDETANIALQLQQNFNSLSFLFLHFLE